MSKATIVPGVHDSIPPEGRVTVELFNPDTGRVRKRDQVENALMDWYRKNAAMNGGRGTGAFNGSYDYDSFNPMQEVSIAVPGTVRAASAGPTGWPVPFAPGMGMSWLWATDQNVTPNQAAIHIPSGNANAQVTSGTKLDQPWVPDGVQFSRGSVQLGSCIRSWDRTRIVAEFGLSYGNGVYRSIGLGSLINRRTAPGTMRVSPAHINNPSNPVLPDFGWGFSGNQAINQLFLGRGGVDPELGVIWGQQSAVYGGPHLNSWDGNVNTIVVSTANVIGSGGQWSVAVNGSDFWVARNKVLYRCVKPTSDVPMTATNTYDLSATIGADTFLDIAVNRATNQLFLLTETSVHVVNGATGAPVSSFPLGLTIPVADRPYSGIEWSAAEQQLFVSFWDAIGAYDGWGYNTGSPSSISSADSCLIRGFTAAGAAAKNLMIPQNSTRTSSNNRYSAALLGLTDSGISFAARTADNFMLGPSMATHALLGSDFEKTSADALRITYDFDFV